ncbi:ChiQ/YbfN family lipoprotein [Erwinia sp. AnSW2-5]|uniref:ChiQ/YbfN family lipoprotein n=1 Tax=Erwinia sp. AnSW2-5 TaxID=3367692 RepID=UPI003858C601
MNPGITLFFALLLCGCVSQVPGANTPRREAIKALDYERCLDAEKMGGGEGVHDHCGQLRQEIQHANQ